MADINNNKFVKGMDSDAHPGEQLPHTYRDGLNFVHLSKDGNKYSVINEDGTTLMNVTFPPNKQVMGYSVLSYDIIVILVGDDGTSQIGYIREDSSNLDPDYGYYHPVAPVDPNFDESQPRLRYPEDNTEFGFSVDYPIDCVSRKLIDTSRVLYFTDNNMPFGRVELEKGPEVNNVIQQSRLVFEQNMPFLDFVKLQENVVGSLKCGIYQFIPRYITNNGGSTTFGIPTNPISVTPNSKDNGVDKYSGEFWNEEVNKNIIIDISDLDSNFTEVEIIATYYNESGVFGATSVAKLPITGSTQTYTFTGDLSEGVSLTLEELRQVPISYTRAKTITQKDNTLFLSNLTDDLLDDAALQQVANHITTDYVIKELVYSGREGTGVSQSSDGFSPTSVLIVGDNQIQIQFSKDVKFVAFNPASSNVPGGQGLYGGFSHILTKNGEPATGLVDLTAAVVTDTVTIDGDVYTCVSTITPGNESIEFLFDGNVTAMAANLASAINNITRSYNANVKDDGGVFKTFVIWDGTGGENVPMSYTGGITGSAALTGETTVVTTVSATALELTSSNTLLYTFDGVSQISTADIINSNNIISIDSDGTSINQSPETSVSNGSDSGGEVSAAGFTDFLDEKIGYDYRSYRRSEVYSFGVVFLFKDGSTSFTYHIPGNDKTITNLGKTFPTVSDYRTGNTTGELGTYISNVNYPLNQNYPGNEPGDELISTVRNVRHHVFPSLQQEPHFRKSSSTTLVRSMGVKFTLDPAFQIPDDIKSNIQSVIFVRERRNSRLNKSIVAQGLINRLVETADHCNNSGVIDGTVINNVRSSYCLQEMPFFNNLETMDVVGDNIEVSSGSSRRGVCYPGATGAQFTLGGGTFFDGRKLATKIRGNRAFFHCPESILSSNVDSNEINNSFLKPSLLLKAKVSVTAASKNKFKGESGEDWLENWAYQDLHGSYDDYDETYTNTDSNNRKIEDVEKRPSGQRRNSGLEPDLNFPNDVTTRWTQGGWEVKVSNPSSLQPNEPYEAEHEFIDQGGPKLKINHDVKVFNKPSLCFSNCDNEIEVGSVQVDGVDTNQSDIFEIQNHLYNAEYENIAQYGELSTASFIPIGRFKQSTSYTCFGGDTFITKFSFNTGGIVWYYPYKRDGSASINRPFRSNSRRDYFHIETGPETNSDSGFKADGYDFRTCHYYFVESDINTYYRHRPEDEEVQNYFPNEPDPRTNLNSFFAYLGNIRAYNGLYSYENTLLQYFVKGSTQTIVSSFETRTIYSEKAKTDSVIDNYRSFLVNNYYDLPAETGPIWDSFIHANNLYLHTPKSLWRTFAEPAATLSGGNISDVVLGTGALFSRPSVQMLTTSGGYGGSISQFGGSHTQMGYIFPDVLQGKVFALSVSKEGPFLKDLSMEGLYTFLHKNMDVGLTRINGDIDFINVSTENANLIDNPFNGIGYIGGYDFKLKRAWIAKVGEFTLSYDVLMQSWGFFHSYMPRVIIPFDNRVMLISHNLNSGSELWEMNVGEKCNFFGTTYPSELTFVVPVENAAVFNNQVHDIDILGNSKKVKDDFWTTFQAYTDRQNTGVLTFQNGNVFNPTKLPGSILYKFKNDEYRIAIPRDSVKDNGDEIFDLDNIYQPEGGTVPIDSDYAFRERMKGDYLIFKLSYTNEGNEFVLRGISTIFENNIR
jgi:hypothetical protein